MHRPLRQPAALALALLLALPMAAPTLAAADDPPRISQEMVEAGLLNAHPDLKWRLSAMQAHEQSRFDVALAEFQRAAGFADKPSAAMVAEMYWQGQGVAQDRPLAYAWMDLAAERQWRPFLVRREGMWAELSEAERARALEVGQAVYAEYGDEVAKPRKDKVLARERRRITGSRVGFVGNLAVEIPGPGGVNIRIRGEDFYAPELWRPERYWAWQERVWKEPKLGTVEVGDVADAGAAPEGED